jgi:L-serine dehydratase
MALSVFDLFKIGIGPSSSHTVGPMRAARQFALRLQERGLVDKVARIAVMLYGSLGATGKGHGSDKAVLLGLCGHEPDSVDVNAIAGIVDRIRTTHELTLLGGRAIGFEEKRDLVFNHRDTLPLHSNGMLFTALDAEGAELATGTF